MRSTSAPTSLPMDEIKFEDAKTTGTNVANDETRVDKKALDDIAEIESNMESTNITECHPPKTSKYTIVFSPASEISTSFSPEHLNPAPAAFASTSTTTACKGDTPRPVKTNAWGKKVKNPTWNDDGDVVGEHAPPVGTDGKGKAMMEKMGWTAGMGLGKQSNGIREPVTLTIKTLKTGLGAKASTSDAVVDGTKISGNPPSYKYTLGYHMLIFCLTKDCGSSLGESSWSPTAEQNPASETTVEENCVWDSNRAVEEIDEGEWDRVRDRSVVVKTAKKPKIRKGIDVRLVTEGENKERFVKFKAWITSIWKPKQIWQRPGVIVEALAAQDPVPTCFRTVGQMGVQAGDHLQINDRAIGLGYEATNLRTKESGIVKIASLIMTEYNEPDEEVGMCGDSWSPASSGKSVAEIVKIRMETDPSYVPPHARCL
jgi:hypothetical protein